MSQAAYYRRLSKFSGTRVKCPDCLKLLTLKAYEKRHAPQCRDLNMRVACIYCSGGQRWASGKRNFKHVIPCLDKFVKKYGLGNQEEEEEEEEEEGSLPMDDDDGRPIPCVECKKFRSRPHRMYGRQRDETCPLFYEPLFERPAAYWKSDIQCSEESGLGGDIYGIVQKYLKGDMEWYHLMVVFETFDVFVKAMEEIKDRMFLLPFSCLCDGLTRHRRVHRHMIMAVEPGAPFKQLWTTQVKYDFGDGSKSKNCIRIKNAFHFIRTIQYVSQRKASCDGTQMKDEVESTFGNAHFGLFRPLHEHAIVCMSTMFEGGMENLLQEQNRNKDVVRWRNHVQRKPDGQRHLKYSVPIGKTGFKFMNCVLPLASYYEPTDEKTNIYLTWLGSKKMYLRINPSLSKWSREVWYKYQAAKGNTVWSLRDEWYVLGPRQQNVLSQIKVAVEETREMEKNRSDKKCRQMETKHAKELEKIKSNYEKELEKVKAMYEKELAASEAKYAASEAEKTDMEDSIQTLKMELSNFTWESNMKFVRDIIERLINFVPGKK